MLPVNREPRTYMKAKRAPKFLAITRYEDFLTIVRPEVLSILKTREVYCGVGTPNFSLN